jgi:hypothetical protein
MSIAVFALYSTITFVAVPLSVPLVPLGVAMADDRGRLPHALRWLETPDALGWGAGTYEPTIKKIYDKHGKRAALTVWLWRNKAYGLRHAMRATPDYKTMKLTESGVRVPPKQGPWFWHGRVTDKGRSWFEHHQGMSFGRVHLSVRAGWKLKPYFDGHRPAPGKTATGMFNGVTIRMDDWDDYRGK